MHSLIAKYCLSHLLLCFLFCYFFDCLNLQRFRVFINAPVACVRCRFDWVSKFPPDQHMVGITSAQHIRELINKDLNKRHFSKWSEDLKKQVIRQCGLASSKYGNRAKRNAILQHLSEVELPLDAVQVQRETDRLGLPPSGSRSEQQAAFYLLSFLHDDLEFPPWAPEPVIKISPPTHDELIARVREICTERILERPPHIYIHGGLGHLWKERIQVWDICIVLLFAVCTYTLTHSLVLLVFLTQAWLIMFKNLGHPSSTMCQFLVELCSKYIKVMNLVLAFSPKSSPEDLRCDLDDAQYKVDRFEAPALFLAAWNAALPAGVPPVTTFKWSEWRWVLGNLIIACKRSVAKAVRTQFQEGDNEDEGMYMGDQEDARHAYYCVGAVWRSIMRWFAKSARISARILELFLDKVTAEKEGLPTNEINSRYIVRCVIIALHVQSLCNSHCHCDVGRSKNCYTRRRPSLNTSTYCARPTIVSPTDVAFRVSVTGQSCVA